MRKYPCATPNTAIRLGCPSFALARGALVTSYSSGRLYCKSESGFLQLVTQRPVRRQSHQPKLLISNGHYFATRVEGSDEDDALGHPLKRATTPKKCRPPR